jgi:AraC family ethanolamine operon transcriptional activator
MNRQRFIAQESEMLSESARQLGWDIYYDQQERGRFTGVADYAGIGETQFFHERYSRALCVHGAVPAGMTTFLLPARRPSGAASFCGTAIAPGTLCAYTPGDEAMVCTPAGYDFINFCFRAERLERALSARCQRSLAQVLPHTSAISAPVRLLARLHAAAQASFAPLPSPGEVLDLSAADQAMEERVLAALCAALTASDPARPGPLAARNHWRCVRTVRNYVTEHLGESLGIETLCRVSGVSERTLSTAFRAVIGLSPQQFVKTRRLTAARHALTAARRTETPIKSIALDLGFWHLGYFARDYKAHFGENPSQTLAQR